MQPQQPVEDRSSFMAFDGSFTERLQREVMSCIGPIEKTGIKKQRKKSQTNKKKTRKEKRHLDRQVLQCVPRAHFFLLVTTPVGLMYGIILPANCDLIFAVMALSAHIVAFLEHVLAVTEQRHNTATFPATSPEISSFGSAGGHFDVSLSQLWGLMFTLDFLFL